MAAGSSDEEQQDSRAIEAMAAGSNGNSRTIEDIYEKEPWFAGEEEAQVKPQPHHELWYKWICPTSGKAFFQKDGSNEFFWEEGTHSSGWERCRTHVDRAERFWWFKDVFEEEIKIRRWFWEQPGTLP